MSGKVLPWAGQGHADRPLPKRMIRPCDWGLYRAVSDLEVQLGTIEAYNRLADAAAALKAKIDAGKAQAQNPLYAVHPRGAP